MGTKQSQHPSVTVILAQRLGRPAANISPACLPPPPPPPRLSVSLSFPFTRHIGTLLVLLWALSVTYVNTPPPTLHHCHHYFSSLLDVLSFLTPTPTPHHTHTILFPLSTVCLHTRHDIYTLSSLSLGVCFLFSPTPNALPPARVMSVAYKIPTTLNKLLLCVCSLVCMSRTHSPPQKTGLY